MTRNTLIDREVAPTATGSRRADYLNTLRTCIAQATDRNDEHWLRQLALSAEGAYQATDDQRFNDLAVQAEKAAAVVARTASQSQ